MRIIGGKKRGVRLESPDGGSVRPTADRVREGLFNILSSGQFGGTLDGSVVVDLFAGVGSMGLEAWSRGAGGVTFIEKNPAALEILYSNIEKLGCGGYVSVIESDATLPFAWPLSPAEMIFVDPPWRRHEDDADLALLGLENLIALGAIADGGVIAVEHDYRRPASVPSSMTILDCRKWGKTAVTLARFDQN